ncbi:MAG: hypothetical protein AB1705_15450 [Verrucomicrobiota bacterium]
MTDEFKKTALALGLHKLFCARGWFDVCTLDELVKLVGVKLTDQERAAFHLMHCVDYTVMPEGHKEEMMRRVLEILRRSPEVQWSVQDFRAMMEPVRVEVVKPEPARTVQTVMRYTEVTVYFRRPWWRRLLS